jgi:heme-degrading monooxygenase HmoA
MDDKRTKRTRRAAGKRAPPQRGRLARGGSSIALVRNRKNPTAESSEPFATFSEWSSEADEKAYAKL